MREPLVSIIMPSYNSESTIELSIKSVINQSYKNWELIVSDDNSNDATIDLVNKIIEKDSRVKLIRSVTNNGAGVARNNAIKDAVGKYIAFLDSDDLWCKSKLQNQIKFMLDNKYAFTYTQYQKIDMNGNLGKIIQPPQCITYSELLKSNVIGCLTAVYDQEILGKMFMPVIRKRQDMALWLDILKKTYMAHCVPIVLAYYREGQHSLSSNKMKILLSQWMFYRRYLKFGIVKSGYYFFIYIFKALKKHRVRL